MITEKWFNGNEPNLNDVKFIRTQVFINEQCIDEKEEFDGTDEKFNSKIVVLYDNNKPFATGRLIEINNKLFIGRVAILKQYRGLNYGKKLMETLIQKAKQLNYKEIYIHAQSYAKKFYEKCGFIVFGEEFFEANITHLNMKIDL